MMTEKEGHWKKPRDQTGKLSIDNVVGMKLFRLENPVCRYFRIAFRGTGNFVLMIWLKRFSSHNSDIGCSRKGCIVWSKIFLSVLWNVQFSNMCISSSMLFSWQKRHNLLTIGVYGISYLPVSIARLRELVRKRDNAEKKLRLCTW